MDTQQLFRSLMPEIEPVARNESQSKQSAFSWPLLNDLLASQSQVIEPLTPEELTQRAGRLQMPVNDPAKFVESARSTISFPEVSLQLADGLRSIQASAPLATSASHSSPAMSDNEPVAHPAEEPVFLRGRSSKLFHVESKQEHHTQSSDLPDFLMSHQGAATKAVAQQDDSEQLQSVFARIAQPKQKPMDHTFSNSFFDNRVADKNRQVSKPTKSLGEVLMKLASQEPPSKQKKVIVRTK